MLLTLPLVALAALAATAAWIRVPLGTTNFQPALAVLGAGVLLFGGPGLLGATAGLLVGLILFAWRTRQARPFFALSLIHVGVLAVVVGVVVRYLDSSLHTFAAGILAMLLLALAGTAATTVVLVLSQLRRPRAARQRTWTTWRLSAIHGGAFNAVGLLLLWALGQSGQLAGVALGLAILAWMAWALRPAFTIATQAARLQGAETDARLDPLTVLPNRMALEEYVADIQLAGLPCVVALVDADHFKAVNDTYGHDAGDAVLFAIAQRLRGACRTHRRPWPDMVGRWGGEEFVLLLPRLPAQAAGQRVDSVRQAVSASPIRHDGHSIPVTCSIGATLCTEPFQLTEAVATADKGTLYAKAHGRNQVVWHPHLDAAPRLTLSFVPEDPPDVEPFPPRRGGA